MKIEEAQELISMCRKAAYEGMNHVENRIVSIPELDIDWIDGQNASALGFHNDAIFVNEKTYKLHLRTGIASEREWKPSQTLVIRSSILEHQSLIHTGIVIHETGHAFNVAAGIPNTENNAYIFEITLLNKLYEEESPLVKDFTKQDFVDYFAQRLPMYKKAPSETLSSLVDKIGSEFGLSSLSKLSALDSEKVIGRNPLILFSSKKDGDAPIEETKKITPDEELLGGDLPSTKH